MRPGSVIVDLAAEKGGNVAVTRADEDAVVHGVTVIGRTNLPSEIPGVSLAKSRFSSRRTATGRGFIAEAARRSRSGVSSIPEVVDR